MTTRVQENRRFRSVPACRHQRMSALEKCMLRNAVFDPGDKVLDANVCSGRVSEYLLEHMPELEICLDLFHLNRNCTDMPGFIRQYGNRICMVHFKDAVGDILVPAGQGDTNWTGVVDACLNNGIPYAFVEQERWDRDPYDCLNEAMDWLDQEIHKALTL